jgi:hypothetical protein
MVIGRDRRDPRVGDVDLRIERGELEVLLMLLGAVVPAREREDHGIVALELAQAPWNPFVIGQRVVRELAARGDVGSLC